VWKIAKLQLNGKDLALDRELGTIRCDVVRPIDVVSAEEARVAELLRATGANRTRRQIIEALEHNDWDVATATRELMRPPPPAHQQPQSPRLTGGYVAETISLLNDLIRTFERLRPEDQQGLLDLVNGIGGGRVDLLTAVSMHCRGSGFAEQGAPVAAPPPDPKAGQMLPPPSSDPPDPRRAALTPFQVSPPPSDRVEPSQNEPDANAVEVICHFPGSRLLEVVVARKMETVADLIRALQCLTSAGKEGRKIAKLELRGEDLADDRLVETISSSCFNPVNVAYSDDGNASGLSAAQEAAVTRLIRAIGGDMRRDDVITALERNGWNESEAIRQLADYNE
jgi:hypothetical protein